MTDDPIIWRTFEDIFYPLQVTTRSQVIHTAMIGAHGGPQHWNCQMVNFNRRKGKTVKVAINDENLITVPSYIA